MSSQQLASPDLAAALLRRLVDLGVIPADRWAALAPTERVALAAARDLDALSAALAAHRLVTPYQGTRVRAGAVLGLVLGNYRLLERIGSGGMGVVYRAEHLSFRTPAAIKALAPEGPGARQAVSRFFVEARAVATLKHPNIVAAIDAGEEPHAGPDGQALRYLVMEYLPGRNLDDLVMQEGPMAPAKACQIGHQIADALTEAHRHGLVHRDIKPSNVMVMPDGQAKLLDFGVARLPADERLTQDGARLGTIGYMAPEQARNPRDVDARADLFGLGATLFFALTGRDPFESPAGAAGVSRPPDLAEFRDDAPLGLAATLARLMAIDPARRSPSAAEAMRELAPFLGWAASPRPDKRVPDAPQSARSASAMTLPGVAATPKSARAHRVLIVDDEEPVRSVCRLALQHEPVTCEEVETGPAAVTRALAKPFDLVLLDVDLPGLGGEQVLKKLRQHPPSAHLKVVMLSGRTSGDDLSRLLAAGADDYLTKPFSVVQLRARVKAALKLKDAQDRTDLLANRLASSHADLELAISARDGELVHARGALVLAMAKLVERRSAETGPHLIRLQRYCRALAEAAAATPAFAGRLDPVLVQAIESAAPLHDIGKVAVPDSVLNKPGQLTPEERAQMQAHTTIGADTLAEVSARYPFATGFFHTAIDIARHHHERWDGGGYPDRLAGDAIPLPARLVALGDVYDALRGRRIYKPALSHRTAVEQILERSPGHFDPALLAVFARVSEQFDRIFRDATD